jgi:signal transduction histidine kinase/ligand-binding sensor domain-containing protein
MHRCLVQVLRVLGVVWTVFAGDAVRLEAGDKGSEAAPTGYHVTRYTAGRDLPQNTIRALLQTQDGYLWIGTLAGLARFDGVKFRVFDASNTPEMRDDAINALAEDRLDESLWINTGNGLLRYRRHRFERFDAEHGVPQPFGELWPARGGGVWYSPTFGHVALLQNGKVTTRELRPAGPLGFLVTQVREEENGNLLVLMHAGLFGLDLASGTVTRLGPPGATDASYRHFIEQSDGTILLAAREGLWRRNAAGWEQIESVDAGDVQSPARVWPSGGGGFWIPWSGNGPPRVARFRAGRSEFVDLTGVPNYPLTWLLEDREGHLWLGTESGLCQLRPKTVQVYAREQGLRNDAVKTATRGPDGTIWLGTAEGASGIKDGQVTNLPPVEPANWGRAEGLLADRRGRVWYGARHHNVVAFDRGSWGAPAPLQLGDSWVRTLYEDRRGRVWGGFDRGVAWIDEAGAVRELPQRLSNSDVRVIHEDRRGDLWFGTYGGGLNRLRAGQVDVYKTARGEYNNRAWCIHEDESGVFWVGSRNGLNRFVPPGVEVEGPARVGPAGGLGSTSSRGGAQAAEVGAANANASRFFTFTTVQGLRENIVNNVQEDDFGNLWLSGLQGIYRVSRRELNEVAAGRQPQAQVLAFGESDGMLNSQCNGGVTQPSGCKDQDGGIWFPTARGVARVDPGAIHGNAVAPPVVIEQVRADDAVIYGDDSPAGGAEAGARPDAGGVPPVRGLGSPYRLEAGRARAIEFLYTANSFAAPHRMRFKYQLEGYDAVWRHDDQNRRAVLYTNLRPGRYRFRVTACNNHGVWSDAPAEFAFALAPHFWQTWLFYVLAGTLLVGLAAGVQAYRLRWERRLHKLEQQKALANERTRIARDLHDDLGTALTGLALEVDVLRRADGDGPDHVRRLGEASARIRALAGRMREVVWAVNPRCDTVSSLASFLEQQTGQFLKADGLRCHLDFPEDIPALPLDGESRHQLALCVREALSNAVRHAAASEIVLGLRLDSDHLVLRIADNGRGFHVAEGRARGRGLANVQGRLERIGGRCDCRSAPGAGTTLEFRVPLDPVRSRHPIES